MVKPSREQERWDALQALADARALLEKAAESATRIKAAKAVRK